MSSWLVISENRVESVNAIGNNKGKHMRLKSYCKQGIFENVVSGIKSEVVVSKIPPERGHRHNQISPMNTREMTDPQESVLLDDSLLPFSEVDTHDGDILRYGPLILKAASKVI